MGKFKTKLQREAMNIAALIEELRTDDMITASEWDSMLACAALMDELASKMA